MSATPITDAVEQTIARLHAAEAEREVCLAELTKAGVVIERTPGGTRWRYASADVVADESTPAI